MIKSSKQIKSSEHTQEEIDFAVDQEMEDWLDKNPNSTDEEYSEARKRVEKYIRRMLRSSKMIKSSHKLVKSDAASEQKLKEDLIRQGYTEDEANQIVEQRKPQDVQSGKKLVKSSKAINSEFIPVTSVNLIKDAANELNDATIVDVFSFGPEVIVVDLDTDDYDEASQIADSLFELLKEKGIDISYDVVDQGEIMVDVDEDMQDMKMIKITEGNS